MPLLSERKWRPGLLALPLKGAKPMQPVDMSYLYQVGKNIQPLSELRQGAALSDILLSIIIAQHYLDEFVNRSIFQPRTSRADGQALIAALEVVRQRAIEAARETDPEKPKAVLDWNEQYNISTGLTRFENVMAAEMRMGGTFLVTPKKGLDTGQMIADGSVSFPTDMGAKVPAAISDAQQAMKCIVFELPTAAGFHLHRANESVLRCYWDAVTHGAARPADRNMGTYLREMEKLKVGSKVVLSSLRDLKDQHRNPLIHPEHSLETVDEAFALYCGVFNAMEGMLKVIPFPAPLPAAPVSFADAVAPLPE